MPVIHTHVSVYTYSNSPTIVDEAKTYTSAYKAYSDNKKQYQKCGQPSLLPNNHFIRIII